MKFEILNIDEDSLDTCSLKISYDKEFEQVVCKHFNQSSVTTEDVQEYVYYVMNSIA